jgi:hypothetical protein
MKNANVAARIAPIAAALLLATGASPLAAQTLVGAGINAAGGRPENVNGIVATPAFNSPILVSGALVAPRGFAGVDVQTLMNRTSDDGEGFEYSENVSVGMLSGVYGATSRITLGAFVPYVHASVKSTFDGTTADESDGGVGDAGLFGRVALMQSTSGATRVAMNGVVVLPTGQDGFTDDETSYSVGAAVSHRAGRMSFHVAPELGFMKDQDATYGVNLAGVWAATDKLGISLEELSTFGGKSSTVDAEEEGSKEIDLAAGLRYRFAPNLSMDGALRYNVASRFDPKPTSFGLQFGLHFGF